MNRKKWFEVRWVRIAMILVLLIIIQGSKNNTKAQEISVNESYDISNDSIDLTSCEITTEKSIHSNNELLELGLISTLSSVSGSTHEVFTYRVLREGRLIITITQHMYARYDGSTAIGLSCYSTYSKTMNCNVRVYSPTVDVKNGILRYVYSMNIYNIAGTEIVGDNMLLVVCTGYVNPDGTSRNDMSIAYGR